MSLFSREELIRYSRQLLLSDVGIKGQEKIKKANVLVVGAGGLGCPALLYLSASGVGTIGIIDFDTVELHNLHRQVLYTVNDIGRPKVFAAEEKLRSLNPFTHIKTYNQPLNEICAKQVIKEYDIVLDGSDNFLTRYLVNDVCVELTKPLVYGTIFKHQAQLGVFNYKGSKNLRDIYPEPPNPEDVPNCNEMGVIGTVPGIIGTYMAHCAIQIILDNCTLQNQLIIFDFNQLNSTKLFVE
jgi:adenylyltransferase/sulfurtransferase